MKDLILYIIDMNLLYIQIFEHEGVMRLLNLQKFRSFEKYEYIKIEIFLNIFKQNSSKYLKYFPRYV